MVERRCGSCIDGACSFAALGDTSPHFIEITGCDDYALTFLQLPAGLLAVRATVHACCIGEHGAGIVINWYDWKEFGLGLRFHGRSIACNYDGRTCTNWCLYRRQILSAHESRIREGCRP